MTPRALITGITGQDGSYLTELLLEKGYEVHGIVRRSSVTVRHRIDHLTSNINIYNKTLFLHYADLDDITTVRRILLKVRPDEVYHLAGQSHVGLSFEIPESTCEFTAMGTLRLLEILRDMDPMPKFLHASSSEIFGRPETSPQDENTPFRPCNPYGVAKAFATQMVRVYREAYGMFACNAICFNHESPRRGESFVTRKITRAVARISLGMQDCLLLGNLDAKRDWGYAPDYVLGMWKLLQGNVAYDIILATGKLTSVREFLDATFSSAGLKVDTHVKIDTRLSRLVDSKDLVGDATKAAIRLDWRSELRPAAIAHLMVQSDIKCLIADS